MALAGGFVEDLWAAAGDDSVADAVADRIVPVFVGWACID